MDQLSGRITLYYVLGEPSSLEGRLPLLLKEGLLHSTDSTKPGTYHQPRQVEKKRPRILFYAKQNGSKINQSEGDTHQQIYRQNTNYYFFYQNWKEFYSLLWFRAHISIYYSSSSVPSRSPKTMVHPRPPSPPRKNPQEVGRQGCTLKIE